MFKHICTYIHMYYRIGSNFKGAVFSLSIQFQYTGTVVNLHLLLVNNAMEPIQYLYSMLANSKRRYNN